jgi:hypothetical protein
MFQQMLKERFSMKQYSQNALIDGAERALRQCLQSVPFACLENITTFPLLEGGDLILRGLLRLPGSEQALLIAVRNNGQPRVVREAAYALFRHRAGEPDVYGLVIAPYLSPQAAEICRQQQVGYVDFAGNALLSFDQVYIERVGHPNPYAEKRDLKTIYAPKAERVLRVLLNAPRFVWQVQRLAAAAQVSLGLASNVKKLLDQREWLQKEPDGTGFALSEPDALLTEWATNVQPNRSRSEAFYSLKPTADNEYDLAQACREHGICYALTGLSGAARYAPYVRYQRATAYVDGDIAALTARLNWKPVASGPNVTLLTPYDAGVFYGVQNRDGIQVASPVQIYLDLQQERGRGAEATTYLRDEVIRPTW